MNEWEMSTPLTPQLGHSSLYLYCMNNSVVAKAERNYIFRGHLYSVMQSKDTEVLVRFWVLGYKKLKKNCGTQEEHSMNHFPSYFIFCKLWEDQINNVNL